MNSNDVNNLIEKCKATKGIKDLFPLIATKDERAIMYLVECATSEYIPSDYKSMAIALIAKPFQFQEKWVSKETKDFIIAKLRPLLTAANNENILANVISTLSWVDDKQSADVIISYCDERYTQEICTTSLDALSRLGSVEHLPFLSGFASQRFAPYAKQAIFSIGSRNRYNAAKYLKGFENSENEIRYFEEGYYLEEKSDK